MVVICILASIICLVLWARVSYQKHCIEDLEVRVTRLNRTHNSEVMELLLHLKEIQNYDLSVSRDTMTRRLLNEKIEEYSKRERYLTERQCDELLCEAGKQYIKNEYKKELNDDRDKDNI